MFEENKLKPIIFFLLLFVFYTLSFGLVLTNSSYYWDDYTVVKVPAPDVYLSFIDAGRPIFAWMHSHIAPAKHSFVIYRYSAFILYFLAALMFFLNLKRLKYISNAENIWLTLFFCLLPFNSSRHLLIMLQYTLCLFSLLVGLFLFQQRYKNYTYRVISHLFLVLSFTIEAHIVIMYALLALLALEVCLAKKPLKPWLISMADYLAIPVLYWVWRGIWFSPSGALAGMNNISKRDLLLSPLHIWNSVYWSIYIKFLNAIKIMADPFYLLTGLLFFALIWSFSKNWHFKNKARKSLTGIFIGIFLLFAAAFPFVVVGKIPLDYDWNTRYQFLFPFGVSLIVLFSISFIPWNLARRLALCLTVVVCVNYNIHTSLAYVRDWYKQISIREHFRTDTIIDRGATVLVRDLANDLSVNNREYRFYEYSGIAKLVYSDQSRLIIRENDYPVQKMPLFLTEKPYRQIYSIADYQPTPPSYRLEILPGPLRLKTALDTLKFIRIEKANPNLFQQKVADLIVTKLVKIP